jgi:hypothetical protein
MTDADKYDLLVRLHEIQTDAINENNSELRDFVGDIFGSLSANDFDEYYRRLSREIEQHSRRPHREPTHFLARVGLFLVRFGYMLIKSERKDVAK